MCDSCTLLFFKLNYINLRLVLHYPKNDITKLGTSYLIDLILLKVIFIFRNTFFFTLYAIKQRAALGFETGGENYNEEQRTLEQEV